MKQDLHKHQVQQLPISEALSDQILIIDVRAPVEFNGGHIPGSVNLPLLDDHERHLIGTIYKKEGSSEAISKGYEMFGPKQRELEAQLLALSGKQPWAILCARGGMRSRIMTQFVNRLGYQAAQVIGGYKQYRNYCLERIEEVDFKNLVVLQGKTGVGKTLVLKKLPQFIDLEGMANHRGSLFGGVGLEPRSQKNFEGLLVDQLDRLDYSQPIFIEGESRKIGPVTVPPRLYREMKASKTLLLQAPLPVRTGRIVEEYILGFPDLVERVRDGVTQLKPALGQKVLSQLLEKFDQGDYDGCFEVVLVDYYDKKYQHSLDQLEFLGTFDTSDLDEVAQQITSWSKGE